MAQELLHYKPTEGSCEGWLARIVELVAIANKDPALGNPQGAGVPDPVAGPRAPGAGNEKAAPAKRALPVRHLPVRIHQRCAEDKGIYRWQIKSLCAGENNSKF
jgi:hypothetical protein